MVWRRRWARPADWSPAAKASGSVLGRALLRPGVRLAILDEPFRGLDFEQRHTLLVRSLERPGGMPRCSPSRTTSPEAMTFERVLVLEDGRIVEDGDPRELPRLHALLEAERVIREEFWNGAEWRRLRLEKWPTYLIHGSGHPLGSARPAAF